MPASDTVPARPEELTAQWLRDVLSEAGCIANDAVVRSFDAERIGEGAGFIGEIVRLSLRYERDQPGALRTLIAKFPSPDEGARAVAKLYGLYEREVRFYSEVAGRAGIRTARCYYSAMDLDAGTYLLLLEDLAASGRIGDQVRGCSRDEAMLAVSELAKFHGGWWNSPELDQIGWLPPGTDLVRASMRYAYPQAWRPCLEAFGDRVTGEIAAVIETLGERVPALLDQWDKPPATMVHGDFRLDNLFFGGEGAPYRLAVIDWQSPNRGWGAYDLAYFVSGSMPPEQHRACEMPLTAWYHEVLVESSVRDYPLERLLDDYRRSLLVALAIMVVNGATLVMSNEGAVELFRITFDRLVAAITDLSALDLLPA